VPTTPLAISVLCTGQKVGGAARGYNPHDRKVPSDYPIRAYLADSGHPASDASCGLKDD